MVRPAAGNHLTALLLGAVDDQRRECYKISLHPSRRMKGEVKDKQRVQPRPAFTGLSQAVLPALVPIRRTRWERLRQHGKNYAKQAV